LDFILAHAEENYFETAADKLRYFVEGRKVDPQLFSGTGGNEQAITFADGFPLCIAYPAPDYDPVVTFTYIDPGHRSIDPYIAHLRRYRPLFRQLRSLQFFYVATKSGRHQEAGELFSMLVRGEGLADLIRMFDVQNRWDNDEDRHTVTNAELIFRNETRKRFRGPFVETLRRLWRRNQLPKDFQPGEELSLPKRKILFHSIVVPGQEGIFGEVVKRWGESWQGQNSANSREGWVSPIEEAKSLHEG
jgi:hypothetical protein